MVLKGDVQITPVMIRMNADPVSLISKILEQNPRSYTKLASLTNLGHLMVKAGLTVRKMGGRSVIRSNEDAEQDAIAAKRITSMCIDAALVEDDFETAYSYVMNKLPGVSSKSHVRPPTWESRGTGLFAHPPPEQLDEWSWKAALQAGKFRRTGTSARPTHTGTTSSNPEIRNLEQRMDCLSLAIRLAPAATLQEILNVYRRCEEELETQLKQEVDEEDAWDAEGDNVAMPGGFDETVSTEHAGTSRHEETPVSLFDLTRKSAQRAQSSLASLSMLNHAAASQARADVSSASTMPHGNGAGHHAIEARGDVATEKGVQVDTLRKRDQLRNAAVGTLTSGIGWLINAPAPERD